jgi:hypothetical protein
MPGNKNMSQRTISKTNEPGVTEVDRPTVPHALQTKTFLAARVERIAENKTSANAATKRKTITLDPIPASSRFATKFDHSLNKTPPFHA